MFSKIFISSRTLIFRDFTIPNCINKLGGRV